MEKLSVLVVEDDPIMRELLKDMLYQAGASRITDCEDAASAHACFAAEVFDIIMLDLGLPDADGHQVMSAFKGANPQQHIVLVTADDSIESIQKAISAGANGYVVKPYSLEKIQDVLNNFVMINGGRGDRMH